MRLSRAIDRASCLWLLAYSPAWACLTSPIRTSASSPAPLRCAQSAPSSQQTLPQSLREDVARHPADFLVFHTEIGAHRFIADHQADAALERDARIANRGVVGYWQGKTIVVVPLAPALN